MAGCGMVATTTTATAALLLYVLSAEQNDFAINIDETSSVESGSNSNSSMKTLFIVNRNLFSLDLIAVLARASTIHYR